MVSNFGTTLSFNGVAVGPSGTFVTSTTTPDSIYKINGESATLLSNNNVGDGVLLGTTLNNGIAVLPEPPPFLRFPMDVHPDWMRQGEWAFGQPAGGGGVSFPKPDPISGATGLNVFGVNLSGDYSTIVGGPYYLTAGPLDFSGVTGATLRFQRWLNSDFQPYVTATLEVSPDGTTWTPVWANGGSEITADSWTQMQYDISAQADHQPTVYVRWGYQVASEAFAYSGWNIDDVEFLGDTEAPLIRGATMVAGQVARPFSHQINASNYPTSYSATSLPDGLTLNTTTGLISGTPTALGTTIVELTATNPSGTATASLSITIDNLALYLNFRHNGNGWGVASNK